MPNGNGDSDGNTQDGTETTTEEQPQAPERKASRAKQSFFRRRAASRSKRLTLSSTA
jgi:hypothetical protein